MWPFEKHDCTILGHALRAEKRKVWRKAGFYANRDEDDFNVSHYRCIAHLSDQERQLCRHCDHVTDWIETYGECFQSFSWPASQAETFNKQGWVYR